MSRQVSKVFISHSIQHDRELATTLRQRLNERNIIGYLAEEVRRYDVPVIDKIIAEIHESDCLVAILSINGRLSPSINQEIGFAVAREIPVILMIEEGVPRGEIGVFAYGREIVSFTRERFSEDCAIVVEDLSQMRVIIRRKIDERREREDRRKNFHLYYIFQQNNRIRDMAVGRVNRIDKLLNDSNSTLDQWQHFTRNMGFIIGTIQETRPSIGEHFRAIHDLMNNPGLSIRFNGELEAMWHLLVQICEITDPINDRFDREELIDSLEEFRGRIEGLEHLIQLLQQEVPGANTQAQPPT